MLLRAAALFSGPKLVLGRTPQWTQKLSALSLGNISKPKECTALQSKAGDNASTAPSSLSMSATRLQPTLSYPVAAAPPRKEIFSEYSQRTPDRTAAAETFKRLRAEKAAKEEERKLAKKSRPRKVRPRKDYLYGSDSSCHWTDSESSDEPSCPAPEKSQHPEPIQDTTKGYQSKEKPTAPAVLNPSKKRKALSSPTSPPSKKHLAKHP